MSASQFFLNDWEVLVDACKRGDIAAHLAVDFAAQMPARPPAGPITRHMLMVWADNGNRLKGGPFRLREDGGFGISGNRNEPFLSRVCGAERAIHFAVLLDLDKHDPSGARKVFDRIHALATAAEEAMPDIGRMAMPAAAKQMHQTMCRFMIRLGETAKAVEDKNPYGVLES